VAVVEAAGNRRRTSSGPQPPPLQSAAKLSYASPRLPREEFSGHGDECQPNVEQRSLKRAPPRRQGRRPVVMSAKPKLAGGFTLTPNGCLDGRKPFRRCAANGQRGLSGSLQARYSVSSSFVPKLAAPDAPVRHKPIAIALSPPNRTMAEVPSASLSPQPSRNPRVRRPSAKNEPYFSPYFEHQAPSGFCFWPTTSS